MQEQLPEEAGVAKMMEVYDLGPPAVIASDRTTPEDVTNWYVCDETKGGCGRECEPITTDRLGNRIPRVSFCCKRPVRVATGRKGE